VTKRFFIWLFWYLLITVILFTAQNEFFDEAWRALLWVIGWWVGLAAWWGYFLFEKYKDRGTVRYVVWGAYSSVLFLVLLGQVWRISS
jgi:hypothetical protein